MYLKSITLKDVRCIQELTLDMSTESPQNNRKWTVILGNNGNGKSTLLKSISLILAGSNALPKLIGEPVSWIRKGKSSCHISAVINTEKGEERELSLAIRRQDSLSDIINRNHNHKSLEAMDRALAHNDMNYFICAYGTSRRLAEGIERKSARKREGCVQTLFDPNAALNPLEAWAIDLHYRKGPKGLSIVRDALRALLPGVVFKGIDKDARDLKFSTPDGIVNLRYLSDGYQNVAAWCGDLLYRITESFPHYKNPLAARGLLIIDEVDLHLHPDWQRQLKHFLDTRLPNFQVVVTTHSPLTVHQYGQEEVFRLERDAQGEVHLNDLPVSPKKLLLHQLYEPAFGIRGFDSFEIEQARKEYRKLKETSPRSAADKLALAHLKETLAGQADWNANSTAFQQQTNELKKLQALVKAAAGSAKSKRVESTKATTEKAAPKKKTAPKKKAATMKKTTAKKKERPTKKVAATRKKPVVKKKTAPARKTAAKAAH